MYEHMCGCQELCQQPFNRLTVLNDAEGRLLDKDQNASGKCSSDSAEQLRRNINLFQQKHHISFFFVRS